jgi:hypothetical protein
MPDRSGAEMAVGLVVATTVALAPAATAGVGVDSDVVVRLGVGDENGVPFGGVRAGVGSGMAVGVAVGVGVSADGGGPSSSTASSRLEQSQTAK